MQAQRIPMATRTTKRRKPRYLVAVYLTRSMMQKLKSTARRERRSVSKQALVLIEKSLGSDSSRS